MLSVEGRVEPKVTCFAQWLPTCYWYVTAMPGRSEYEENSALGVDECLGRSGTNIVRGSSFDES